MDVVQKNIIESAVASKANLSLNIAIWTTQPIITAKFAELTIRINAALNLEHLQSINIKGIAANKKALKQAMAKNTVAIIEPLKVFARATGNIQLAESLNITEDSIIRANTLAAANISQNVFDVANPIAASLTTYGITAAKLTSLQTSIANYTAVEEAPKNAAVIKSTYTFDLAKTITEIEATLTDIDGMMELYKTTNPTFYHQYFTTRQKPTGGNRSLALKVHVTNHATTQAMANVIATISSIPKSKKTTKKGNFQIKNLAPGTYTITFKKHGFHDVTSTFYINAGETTYVNVEMVAL